MVAGAWLAGNVGWGAGVVTAGLGELNVRSGVGGALDGAGVADGLAGLVTAGKTGCGAAVVAWAVGDVVGVAGP